MIYTNGCSFTYGDELSDPSLAWPYLLAKKLNVEVFNDAVSGGTNYRTVYRTTKNIKEDYELYVIAWTSNARHTYYKADNNFEINFNPQLVNKLYGNEKFYSQWGKDLYLHWHNELYSFKMWLQQIIHLQAVFEKFNKKFLMINTMPNNLDSWLAPRQQFVNAVRSLVNFNLMSNEQIFAEYDEINYYVSCINKENYYKWNEFSITSLTDQFAVGPYGHLLEEGHEYISNSIYNYLQCSK
jgi:hypothetical protein